MSQQESNQHLFADQTDSVLSFDEKTNTGSSSPYLDKVVSWRDSWSLSTPEFIYTENKTDNRSRLIRRVLSVALMLLAILLLVIALTMLNTEEVIMQQQDTIDEQQANKLQPVTGRNAYSLLKQSHQQVFDAVMFCFASCESVANNTPVLNLNQGNPQD